MFRTTFLPALLLSLALATPTGALAFESSLYERLGGKAGIQHIADTLIDSSSHDPKTAPYWKNVNLVRVKTKLAEYLCSQTGGGCVFDDDNLRVIHAGQHISEGAFYSMVEQLRSLLDSQGIGAREKNELLRVLAPSKRDVVQP